MGAHTTNVLAGLLISGALVACHESQPSTEPLPTVEVATPLVRPVTDWDDYAGRFEAVNAVEVRPRVSGLLQSVHFQDGQKVTKGQLLFVIDPRPFAAALAQSRAQLARAQAEAAKADADFKRGQSLRDTHVISESNLDTLNAARLQGVADVAAAEAAVQTHGLSLEFTRVVAPLDGNVSSRRLAPGNLVSAETTLLTTIVTLDPIRFVFDAPESALLKYKREQQEGARANPVDIRLQDEADYHWKGEIEFVDNALDAASGTIRARAVVANPQGFLTPGMFGHMRRFASSATVVLLIPDEAVVNDQTRQIAYVVGNDGIVAQRTIEMGRLVDGLRVVRAGLRRSDEVVVSGVQRARPGRKVSAVRKDLTAFPSGISRGENSQLDLPGTKSAP